MDLSIKDKGSKRFGDSGYLLNNMILKSPM